MIRRYQFKRAMRSVLPRQALRITLSIAAIVASAEFLVMMVMFASEPGPGVIVDGLIDAAALSVLVSPLVYFWIVKPFVRKAEQAQSLMKSELEEKAATARELSATLARLRFQKLILDQHAPVTETDRNGNITYANEAFCRLSGYASSELIGRSHRAVSSDHHPAEFWKDMYEALTRGEVWHGEVCNKAKDGSTYWVQATNAAVHDADGTPVGFISVRTDITDSKRREASLEETQTLLQDATIKAEAANLAKSEFLAMMSHEIRTPMNGFIGMLNLLMEESLSEEQNQLVRSAADCADSLLVIINDILDYSKMEAGRFDLEEISFDPSDVADSTIQLLQSRAHIKGLALETDIATDMPHWVVGDPTRLRQILINLVGNAIKFTETGHVKICASHRTLADDTIELSFEVRDTGIGIPSEARSRLFDRFRQADSSTVRKYGGTGLGLAICRQIVTLMKGEIGVESQVGKGSRFWFTLRTRLGEEPVEEEPESADAYDKLLPARLRILVAEDNATNQKFISSLLSRRGHSVVVVSNGRKAVDAVQAAAYDLVLMDVQMPEMDGPSAARNIRRLDGARAAIPIIALTANAMPGQREEYLAAGMDDCVVKPIDPVLLFSRMAKLVRHAPLQPPPGPEVAVRKAA